MKRIALLGLALGISVIAGLAVEPAVSTPGVQFAGALAFLLAVLAGAHIAALRQTHDALNLLTLTLGFFAIAFFIGGIYAWFSLREGSPGFPEGFLAFPSTYLTIAVAMAGLGSLALAAGYLIDPFHFVRLVLPPPQHLAQAVHSGPLIVCLAALGWGGRLLTVSEGGYFHIKATSIPQTGASWFVFATSLLPVVALAFVGALTFGFGETRPSVRWRRLFFVLLVAELAWALPTGSREQVVRVLVVVGVVLYYARRRLPSPMAFAALIFALVFVLFPVINAYRSEDFRSSPTGALVSASTKAAGGSLTATLDAGGNTLARFADVTVLARILQLGRDRITFSSRDTVVYSLQAFLPRAIYPEKRQPAAFGNEFGRAYGFIWPQDFNTSIAVTVPGELYLGGGWLALLLGMPLIGAVLRLLDEYLSARRSDAGVLALYAVIAPSIVIGFETSIAVGVVGTIKVAIFMGLVVAAVSLLVPRLTDAHVLSAEHRGAR